MTQRRSAVLLAVAVAFATACDYIEYSSVATDGTPGTGHSSDPTVSDDGRIVAFHSSGTNLVANDTNGVDDIFVRDHATGTTTRVSVSTTGTEANGDSAWAALSDDGRYVAFMSRATNLAAGDTNTAWDVYRHDRTTGETVLVSADATGSSLGEPSDGPAVDGSGDVIAFRSRAALVADDTNDTFDVYVRDLTSGKIELISRLPNGSVATEAASWPTIDDSGTLIAFTGAAPYAFNDTDSDTDAFVHDRTTGTTHLSSDGPGWTGESFSALISGDGNAIAYRVTGDNSPVDTNGEPDVYRRELNNGIPTGDHEIVSWTSAPGGNDGSSQTSRLMSDDGLTIGYWTDGQKTADDTDATNDAYVWMRDPAPFPAWPASTVLLDRTNDGSVHGDGTATLPVVSGDGRFAAWQTGSDNLTPQGNVAGTDIALRYVASAAPLTPDATNQPIAPGDIGVIGLAAPYIDPLATIAISPAAGVTIQNVDHDTINHVTLVVAVDPTASPGPRNIIVRNPSATWSAFAGSLGTCTGCLTINP